MKFMILHLSDIHIRNASDPILARDSKIAQSIFPYLPQIKHLIILISGDIAYSGRQEEYDMALGFIQRIKSTILSEKQLPIEFICVPGNHDNNFDLNTDTRKIIIDSLCRGDFKNISNDIINTCTSIQNEYFEFRNKLSSDSHIEIDPLWERTIINLDGKTIIFEGLNISWVSKLKEEPGTLLFPIDQYKHITSDPTDLRISLMHHPLNWFSQSIYRDFRTHLRQVSDLIITGHEHIGNAGFINETESGESTFIEGCALQSDHGPTSSEYNIIIIDTDNMKMFYRKFKYKDKIYAEVEIEGWHEYKDLPRKSEMTFSISARFKDILDDPGPFFKQKNNKCVKLSDIFVFPTLKKMRMGEDDLNKNVSSEKLLHPPATSDGVLLEGSEKSGRTSLLYQIFLNYHDLGFVPLYINGKDIIKGTDNELEAIIKRQFGVQYNKTDYAKYQQLTKHNKIILLDNFEDSTLKTGHLRAGYICSLKDRFGHIIITIDELFEVRDMLDGEESKELSSLMHYQIRPFGHVGRSQLIEKWVSIDETLSLDDSQFLARCDQAERLTNTVMTKNVIPSIPLHLLTLLQSLDANQSSEFKDSALGYYYQFLLTGSFQQAGVKADMLTEIFQYASHLAWEFHRKERLILSFDEIFEFNKAFSKQWHTVDCRSRINLLVESKLLRQSGDNYEFRYPYMYYYLKGKYISTQLDEPGMREYIKRCCNHLYVRDHANTILFLVHHLSDDFILKSIEESLQATFLSRSPVDFLKDTGHIIELIKEGPDLAYSGESPKAHRKRENESRDELQSKDDGLSETEENGTLSLLAQIVMLFKTTEILGQLLKTQYSTIRRQRKNELLNELFNAPLRALDDYYSWISNNPDQIISVINEEIRRRGTVNSEEEGRTIARRIVGTIIQVITFSFIHKISQNINTEHLMEDIHTVISNSENFSFKIIELCIKLDSPKPIPRALIEDILKSDDVNLLVYRLVNLMVITRLYMFDTTASDRTWLDSQKIVPMKQQNSISYQEEPHRSVK